MTHVKDFNNLVLPLVLKIDNVMLVFIGKRFFNVLSKNIMQFMLEKRENVEIVKINHLNILLMIIIY